MQKLDTTMDTLELELQRFNNALLFNNEPLGSTNSSETTLVNAEDENESGRKVESHERELLMQDMEKLFSNSGFSLNDFMEVSGAGPKQVAVPKVSTMKTFHLPQSAKPMVQVTGAMRTTPTPTLTSVPTTPKTPQLQSPNVATPPTVSSPSLTASSPIPTRRSPMLYPAPPQSPISLPASPTLGGMSSVTLQHTDRPVLHIVPPPTKPPPIHLRSRSLGTWTAESDSTVVFTPVETNIRARSNSDGSVPTTEEKIAATVTPTNAVRARSNTAPSRYLNSDNITNESPAETTAGTPKSAHRLTLMGVLDANPTPTESALQVSREMAMLSNRNIGNPTNVASFVTPDHVTPTKLKFPPRTISMPTLVSSSNNVATVPIAEVQKGMLDRGRLSKKAMPEVWDGIDDEVNGSMLRTPTSRIKLSNY
ncbi:hypothetical protein HDU76_005065 [Blyttiomyces sp. JEL0837]|nr:hypothetical protein HDU76_005065 [Blyttiomyces sp. JEL0837]